VLTYNSSRLIGRLIDGEDYVVRDEDWVDVPLERHHFLADPLTRVIALI
jgi:hypothetical protein